MIVGMGLIIFGSDVTVDAATELAKIFGMSERFIGLTIVALGTSLPELVTSVVAARRGKADIAIGNIVGSNIFNILIVVGISAMITPVPFAAPFLVDTAVALATMVLLLVCCLVSKKVGRISGIIMLVCYGVYFVYLLVTNTGAATPESVPQPSEMQSALSLLR
jgi:cation:H+ antiporter